jgi:hypothetical protein
MRFLKKASLGCIKNVSNPNIVITLRTKVTKMKMKCSALSKVKNKFQFRVIAGFIWFKNPVSQYKVPLTQCQLRRHKQL